MNEQQLPPLPEAWYELYTINTPARPGFPRGEQGYTADQMHAYARAALAAQGVPAEWREQVSALVLAAHNVTQAPHTPTFVRMLGEKSRAVAAMLAATPAPAQEVMLNGLTEAETNATASVAGLSERGQVTPETQAEIDAEIRAAEELHPHAQQIDEPVFHLRSYGDVSASDLEHYAAKHIQTPKAQQAEPTKWCYSTDEERFHGGFASRDEAISELEGGGGWISKAASPKDLISAFHIGESAFEAVSEALGDTVGEVAECFAMTKDEKTALGRVVLDWISEGPGFNCFGVREVEGIGASSKESGNADQA